jgi:hypothetical protein
MSRIRSTSNPEGLYITGDGQPITMNHRYSTRLDPPPGFEREALKYLESPGLARRRIKSRSLSLAMSCSFMGRRKSPYPITKIAAWRGSSKRPNATDAGCAGE